LQIGILNDPLIDISKAVMANVDAIYLLNYATGQFTCGVLADRIGPSYIVIGGLIATLLAGWLAYEVFNDWRHAFFGFSVLVLTPCILFFKFQRTHLKMLNFQP